LFDEPYWILIIKVEKHRVTEVENHPEKGKERGRAEKKRSYINTRKQRIIK